MTTVEGQWGRRGRLRHSLTVRLGVALCLGASMILVAAAVWNLQLQRAQLTQVVRLAGERCADVIRSATREAMLHDNPGEVKVIIETIGGQETIERIRIFDKRGRIRTSTDHREVGALVDTGAEQCFVCHDPDQPLERLDREDRTRIFHGPDGNRVLAVIAPIRNEPACAQAACHAHDAATKVLGVLDVQLSLANVDRDLAHSEKQMIGGVVATVGAVLALAWLLIWLFVLRPVRRLTGAALRVTAGELGAKVSTGSADEIGAMSDAWNSMVDELGRAREQLQEWGHGLERRVDEKTKELERAHRQMILVEKMASLGKLAAVVAHEINNPLTGIGTFARLLRRKLGDGRKRIAGSDLQEADRILKMIHEESARCGNIVRNLLLFSKTPGARFSEQDLGPILERCFLLLKHRAELNDVTLGLDVPDSMPKLTCDASQVQQLVLALAMNALEATPAGGTVTLRARPDAEHDGMMLEVNDTGKGIAPEHLARIYEPFFSTKEEATGIGLGLAVAYGIVDRHRGKIDAESTVGKGTAFRVWLPLRQPSEEEHRDRKVEVGVS